MNCFHWKWSNLRDEIELVQAASNEFDLEAFLAGELTPVFFGSAINNFGVQEILNSLIEWAPAPQPRDATSRSGGTGGRQILGFCV
jgi:peptide chain release factor 3